MEVEIRDTDLAWLAGLLDGEGCLFVRKCLPKGRPLPTYTATIRIEMCSEEAVCKAAEIMGAVVNSSHYRSNRKVWRTYVHNRAAFELLSLVRPYLTTKAKEADALLAASLQWKTERPLGNEQRAFRESLYSNLRNLKVA